MLDRHLIGEAERLSPEAPVPMVRVAAAASEPGGAANVAANVIAAGATCALVGVVGADAAGAELRPRSRRLGIAGSDLLLVPDRATTNKTRVVAQGQQVLRMDEEDSAEVSAGRSCATGEP